MVGSAGHDPNSAITALTPNPGFDPTPDASGHRIPSDAIISPTAITSATDDPDYVTIWTCSLPAGTATGSISSYYLMAKFVYPTNHADYDLLWVWSMAYSPLQVKTDGDDWTLELGVAY